MLAVAVFTALGSGAAGLAQSDSMLLSVGLPDQPTAGARVFAQKRCARCHTLGATEPRIGPDLSGVVLSGTVLDLAGSFWNHAPIMLEKMQDAGIQPPVFDTDEMAGLVAYLTLYRHHLTQFGERGDADAGRRVFVAKRCVECHGPDVATRTGVGPGLEKYRGASSAIFVAQAMWNHGAQMARVMQSRRVEWPMLTGNEMRDLVAYLRTGGDTATDVVYLEPGSPARGRELFATKRCSTCHAIAGTGGTVGPDLAAGRREMARSASEIAALMWDHSQGMTVAFERQGIERVTFSGQEMADVIAYLHFVNYAHVRGTPARGARVFADRCSTCHTIGDGARVGPDLAAAGLEEPLAIIAAMWNHAATMQQELRARGLPWPRFEPGEAADLTAFLLSRRPSS